MPFAIVGLLVAMVVVNRMDFQKETMAVLLLNPALIFSIGRGYSEYTYLAMIGNTWALWRMSRNYKAERSALARETAIGLAAMLVLWVLILKWKIEP